MRCYGCGITGHIYAECWNIKGLGITATPVTGASFVKTNSYCVLENLHIQFNSYSACDCAKSITICTDIGNILSKSSNRPLRFYQFSSKS